MGKVLGGGSAINVMAWSCGHKTIGTSSLSKPATRRVAGAPTCHLPHAARLDVVRRTRIISQLARSAHADIFEQDRDGVAIKLHRKAPSKHN
jgi:hypothetical protein